MATKEKSMSKLEGLTLQQCRDVIGQFYKANIDEGKSYTVNHFLKMGVPRATIGPVHLWRGTTPPRGSQKWKTSCEDDEEKEDPAH